MKTQNGAIADTQLRDGFEQYTADQPQGPNPSLMKKLKTKLPAPPKGMNKVAAGIIRQACESCSSRDDLLKLKMKVLYEQIENEIGEKPSAEMKQHVKEYAGSIITALEE